MTKYNVSVELEISQIFHVDVEAASAEEAKAKVWEMLPDVPDPVEIKPVLTGKEFIHDGPDNIVSYNFFDTEPVEKSAA